VKGLIAGSTKEPFGILTEGLFSEKNRGDRTAIELFVAGIRGCEAGLRQCLNDGTTSAQ
jgi:hypothetical protein